VNKKTLLAVASCAALLGLPAAVSAASYIVMGKPGAQLDQAVASAGGRVTKRLPAVDSVVAESENPAFKRRIAASNAVQAVLPNLQIRWKPRVERGPEAISEAVDNPPNAVGVDPRFNLQWGHDAVNAPDAWNAGYTGAGARVAVLDGGFSLNHPELVGRYDPDCTADMTGEGIAYGPNIDDPTGIFSHGNHTAGTIGAARNGIGVIGIAYEAQLCLIKVLFNHGSGSFADVVTGIVFAADKRVDVSNLSLGGELVKSGEPDLYTAREAAEFKNFINRAVTYAYQKDALVITSAGNDANDGDKDKNMIHLPSDTSHAMSVSATAPIGWGKNPTVFLDNPASYTNYGRSAIDIAAPGGDFQYFFVNPNEVCVVAGVAQVCYVFDYVYSVGAVVGPSAFFYWSAGTSMAAPHVAGVAALLVGKHGRMKPSQLRSYLERGADDLGQRGNDPYYGRGRVNAIKALGLR
jgi:subtilisin family serine protease